MKKYIVLFALIPTFLFAQNNGDSLKFEIIKQSVSFLSTDKESFKESKNKPSDCIYPRYDCLKKYCTDNKLTNAEGRVDEWKKLPSGSEVELAKLCNKIIIELTTGTELKKKRTNLSSYGDYKESLDLLTAAFSATAPKDTGTSKPPPINTTDNSPTDVKADSTLPLIALILGGLALALSIVNFFLGRAHASDKQKSDTNYQILNDDLKDLKNRIIQKSGVDLKPLEDKIRNSEIRIQNLESQNVVEPIVEKKINTPNNNSSTNSRTVFAKLPDTGNGFSQSIITDDQNGEQIYEIEIRGDKATFAVSGDSNAQKYALSDFNYYLSNACDFLNQPVKNCRINTLEKGILTKSGGNWIIQSKAKIEFK